MDRDFEKCCNIIDKLEEVDSRALRQLAIMLVANIQEARDLVIGQYEDVLTENDDY